MKRGQKVGITIKADGSVHQRLTFYIVRNKNTLAYLPAGMGVNGRGTTHQELVEPNEVTPPRLFHLRSAAQKSLNWWLKGVTSVSRNRYGNFIDYGIDENWTTERVESRIKEDMEVVPVELTL